MKFKMDKSASADQLLIHRMYMKMCVCVCV